MRSLRCSVHLKYIIVSFNIITQYIFENVVVSEISVIVKTKLKLKKYIYFMIQHTFSRS